MKNNKKTLPFIEDMIEYTLDEIHTNVSDIVKNPLDANNTWLLRDLYWFLVSQKKELMKNEYSLNPPS